MRHKQEDSQAAENHSLPLVLFQLAMIIIFTLTKEDYWRFHPHAEFRNPLPLLLRFLWVPALLFGVCDAGGLGLVNSLAAAAAVWLLPLIPWGLMMAEIVRDVSKPGAIGERIAEVGKFDFRYGRPPSAGYYYHWSNFSEITDSRDGLFFILTDGRQIIIPRSAFSSENDAQAFLTLARDRRQTAEMNQHYSAMGSGGVWPPPPRMGA